MPLSSPCALRRRLLCLARPFPVPLVAPFGALLLVFLLPLTPRVWAQPEGVLQLGSDLERFLDRQAVAGRLPGVTLSNAPLSAGAARAALDTLEARQDLLSTLDRRLLAGFRGQQPAPGAAWANGLWGALYRDGQHLVSASGDSYRLVFDPMLALSYGSDVSGGEERHAVWQNTRGLRVAGHLGRVFFETRVEENQRRDARDLFSNTDQTAPRLGNVQRFEDDALDYYRATGVVGVRTRFVEASGGRDRLRWGPGRTGLMLSGYAAPFEHLQLRADVWRLQYQTLFARFTSLANSTSQRPYETSYGALHRLALRLGSRGEVAVYEALVFSPDTLGTGAANRRRGFEPAYLNPVVLYRSVEQDRNSPDNALIGGSASWIVTPGMQVYGEALLDEFSAGLVGKKSWANKWGFLGGVRFAPAAVPGLLVQVEAARLRPYLYSHLNERTAVVHYGSGLGHPAGPNALDLLLHADWTVSPRLRVAFDLAHTRRGRNDGTLNYGSDPRVAYTSRVRDMPVPILQGVRQTAVLAEGHVDYGLLPGLVLEAALRGERVTDAQWSTNTYLAPMLGLRWGVPFRSLRYD